ncbi:MAG: protein kinase [bacterium]
MIGDNVSHYTILEKLGGGGMGVVYKAEDTKLKRVVALKFLPHELTRDQDAKTRFIHEARAASALQHHNICTIHEIDETSDGRLFIAMDCYEGKTLKERIAEGPMPVGEAIDVISQVAAGLSEAHAAGMVHRDIKPANIVVTDRGVVKILDFGLAKLAGMTKVTRSGTTVGTVAYMSPEQARGAEVDGRSDVFSLGVVLYELLTGKPPFEGEHEAVVLYGIMKSEPEALAEHRSDIPETLEDIERRALAKNPDERYQTVDEFRNDLENVKRSLTGGSAADTGSGKVGAGNSKRTMMRFLIPLAVVIAGVLLWWTLKPSRVGVQLNEAARLADDTIAIMYFENVTDRDDPDRLGEIATNLLITDLSESEHLKVLSSQRLYDILKQHGKQDEKILDRATATQVAVRANARHMLLGSILQVKPSLVITSQLVDVNDGTVAASQKVAGEPGESIFPLVDRLSDEIASDLDIPVAAAKDGGTAVAETSTGSQEAYKYYLEGMEYGNKLYAAEAIASFEKALQYDSTFAMAYYRLSRLRSPGVGGGREEAIAKAVQYAGRASPRERSLIMSRSAELAGDYDAAIEDLKNHLEKFPDEKDAYLSLARIYRSRRDYKDAIVNWNKIISLDPLDKLTYNYLAYDYFLAGERDSSIMMINKYVELAPDEANPYDTQGELYMWLGEIDKAIASYKKAVQLKQGKPFESSLDALGTLYLYKRNYEEAEKYFRRLLASEDARTRANGRLKLASIPIYQGKLNEGLEVLSGGIWGDQMDGYEGGPLRWKFAQKAVLYFEQGDWDRAAAEFDNFFDSLEKSLPQRKTAWRAQYITLLAKNGDLATAEDQLARFRDNVDSTDPKQMDRYWFAKSQIALEQGDPDSACAYLERLSGGSYNKFIIAYDLGVAYLAAGRLSEAVEELERYLGQAMWASLYIPLNRVRAYYYLGIAFEKSGWRDKAIEQYETFLEIWKDADPDLKEIDDAKRRLSALKNAG